MKQVAIVGPTASGKTALALKVAEMLGGEVICADSRTIYRGMDIGTAKPTAGQQRRVRHHLLDILEPTQQYSAGAFKRDALLARQDIAGRGRLPILAGGSGLYVYSVVYDYQFPAGADSGLRRRLNALSLDSLVGMLREKDAEAAEYVDLRNRRRVVRAIETAGEARTSAQRLAADTLLVGLFPGMDNLRTNITQRTRVMIEEGLVGEVQALVSQYGADVEAFRTVGYAEVIEHLNGAIGLDRAVELIELHSGQLARRQMTWYRRNSDIQWFERADDAYAAVAAFYEAG